MVQRLLEEVLGSDSDEDSPKASRKRPKVAVRYLSIRISAGLLCIAYSILPTSMQG